MARRRTKKQQSGKKWWIIIPVAVVLLIIATYLWYKNQVIEEARFVRYDGFGIDIPEAYDIHGIDVSWYQNFIDWPSVKKMKVQDVQVGFAFIKATEGLGNVDKQFRRNWKKAREAGYK